jgi:predicted signal transduction protein with EAL and GGDEF domain
VTRDADLAMYEAKSAGRGRVAIYDSSMHQHIAGRMRLEADLAQAIQEGALTLVFQPLYQLNPYRLTGLRGAVPLEPPRARRRCRPRSSSTWPRSRGWSRCSRRG